MSRRPHPGRRGEQEESELDQFEAYGSYSYEYMHHPQEEEEGGEDEYDDPYAHGPRGVRRVPIGRERPVAVKKRSFWGRLLFLVVCAVVALIVLQGTVFRLQYVYVVGNEKKSKEEIVMASGLVRGLNIFAVSEEEIRRNLGKDHTLQFLRIQKELPSTVYVYVSERLPVAAIQCRGLM